MLIEFDRVSVVAQERTVLHDVTVQLTESRIGVVGANGSGKSTLVRLLNGLALPASGSVRVDGLDTASRTREVRRKVGFVFQNPDNQIIYPVVAEDLAFGLRNLGVPRAEIEARVQAGLDRLGIGHLADRPSHGLSGGEKQMVALAAVLVMEPSLIVFDEPTTLLDLRNRNRLRDTIAALPQAAIVVTHDLDLLEDFQRVLVLADGGICYDGPPSAAVDHYREYYG